MAIANPAEMKGPGTAMITELIPTEQIKPNPWQPRTSVDPAAISELAESIAAQGLLQPPLARAIDGHYELAFGHRRLLAWQNARPGEPMPLQVGDLTDRQMAEQAVTENAARLDLNPIERAQAIKRLVDEFHLTQLEVGKLFGLASQGAVSNMLRLLQLPADVQQLLASGQIAERHARALLPLAHTPKPKMISIIAAELIKLQENERDEKLDNKIWQAVYPQGQRVYGDEMPWTKDWPSKPIIIEHPNTKLGEPGEVPACKGCRFLIVARRQPFCLRPSCYALKLQLFAQAELQRCAKRLGIAAAAPGEKVSILVGETYIGYEREQKLPALIKNAKAKPYLRLIPARDTEHGYDRQKATGSKVIMLGTVNQAALNQLEPQKKRELSSANSSWQRDQKAREERSKECKRLCLAAGSQFADVMPTNPALLELLMERYAGQDQTHDKDMQAFKQAVDKRAYLARLVLLSAVPHSTWNSDATPAYAAKKLAAIATKLKVRLPKGWDAKPEPAAKKPAKKH